METEVLWNILAKPEDAKYAFTLNAQSLVDRYPQSGLFRALLAANGNEENIRHAAVRFNPAVLYKLIYAPQTLPAVSAGQIYSFEAPLADGEFRKPAATVGSETDNDPGFQELNIGPEKVDLPFLAGKDEDDDDDAVNQDIDAAEGKEAHSFTFEEEKPGPVTQTSEQTFDDPWKEQEEDEVKAEAEVDEQPEPLPAAETQPVSEPVAGEPASQPQLIPLSEQAEYFHQDIDDEIYDEIVSIDDIGLEFINSYKPSESHEEDEAEVNSAQHFVFEPQLSAEDNAEQETYAGTEAPASPPYDQEEIEDIRPYVPPVIVPANEIVLQKRSVSNYNDETYPYTFMWWLEKTRQEHSATYAYQPYTNDDRRHQQRHTNGMSGKKDLLDELQVQYVENIYTLNAVDDLEKRVAPANEEHQSKEDRIIDRFIKTEPHIKPPTDVKLDSENKARRSSEDGDELITETLARIYAEQMLYSKAIAAYKKLMLKYPEKSLYFAGQIEQLEKKPN